MKRVIRTLSGRLSLGILITHLFLLPVLYLGTLEIIRAGHHTQFIEYARSSAFSWSRQLAGIDLDKPSSQVHDILNQFGLSTQIVFLKVSTRKHREHLWKSDVHHYDLRRPFKEDSIIGGHNDSVYHLSVPLENKNGALAGHLFVGLDETMVQDYINQAQNSIVGLIIGYVTVLTLFALVLGLYTAIPLRRLRETAKKIAAGEHVVFTVPSLTEEIADLSQALESMHQQLVAQRDRAQIASHSKSEFLSHMSHELRTPLNAIIGFSQLMLAEHNSRLPKDTQENIREILHAGNHLLALIDEGLDLSRVESGRIELHLSEFSAHLCLEGCIAWISPIAEKHLVHLHSDIQWARAYILRADYTRLKQVLLNLLSNAIKYNHAHGKVTLSGLEIPPHSLEISVTNTGTGLSPEQLAQLFQPFERLGAENLAVEGTGIGLVISKRLIELMGGEIGAECEKNVGCRFWIKLPYWRKL